MHENVLMYQRDDRGCWARIHGRLFRLLRVPLGSRRPICPAGICTHQSTFYIHRRVAANRMIWLTCTDAVHLDPRRTVRGIQAELGLHQRVHLPWGLPPIVGPDHVCHVHSVKALVSVVPKLFVDRYNLC